MLDILNIIKFICEVTLKDVVYIPTTSWVFGNLPQNVENLSENQENFVIFGWFLQIWGPKDVHYIPATSLYIWAYTHRRIGPIEQMNFQVDLEN